MSEPQSPGRLGRLLGRRRHEGGGPEPPAATLEPASPEPVPEPVPEPPDADGRVTGPRHRHPPTDATRPPSTAAPPEGATMSKQEELAQVITTTRRSIPELHGVMIATTDGMAIVSDFPETEAEKVAAMAATALGLGQRITERTALGGMQETVVRGDNGYLVVYGAGSSAVLVMSGPTNSNLGLMRIEARSASAQISQVLR